MDDATFFPHAQTDLNLFENVNVLCMVGLAIVSHNDENSLPDGVSIGEVGLCVKKKPGYNVLGKFFEFWHVDTQFNHGAFLFLGFLAQPNSKNECAFFLPENRVYTKDITLPSGPFNSNDFLYLFELWIPCKNSRLVLQSGCCSKTICERNGIFSLDFRGLPD